MKVLIIDDDPATTEMLSLTLAQLGMQILVAHRGDEGVDLVLENNPDLIVLDYMMPVMDGMQTCKAIREFSQVPILMLSAVDNPYLVADLLNAGADDFLVKPVGVTMLTTRIKRLLRSPAIQQVAVDV